ncbi:MULTISPECIES: SURF1 family cytochrome oxidase biogenesis protein [Cellulomonas]|uniref:SURF1 family cytochrome oxidase biogenesis protein n=1 Tax=Cellulomonas TaxID=1707 RepID=UPI0010A90687|nr:MULTISPECIES: SURF1 family protein [Cellulomonas]
MSDGSDPLHVPAVGTRADVRRRALGLLALAVAVAVVCTFLGRWQWHRHVARAAAIAVVEENYAAAPTDLADVVPDPSAPLPDDDAWRRVTVTGRWLADATVLLRNRPVDGTPSYHVLVPLLVTDAAPGAFGPPVDAGRVLVVDRGWVPTGEDGSSGVDVPPPPAGDVEVTVRLRPGESPSTRDAPAGQVHTITPAQVVAAGGEAVPADAEPYAAYGGLVSELPPAGTELGALPAPSTDPGSHLSYAFQWWVFALGGLVAFSVAARREWRDAPPAGDGGAAGPDGRPGPPPPPAPPRPRRARGRDELDEDAEIDAQLGGGASRGQASAMRSR